MGGTTVREKDLIDRTPEPRTRQSLAKDLRRLGLETGAVAIVHSSLSSLGWVCGASVAVVQALMDVITPSGTLVMPAHSGEYSDPANWEHPPVPDSWQGPIRECETLLPEGGRGLRPRADRLQTAVLLR
jgi:aminoglycoside 3-N-acetyltransferase